jgi:hypothetical protein
MLAGLLLLIAIAATTIRFGPWSPGIAQLAPTPTFAPTPTAEVVATIPTPTAEVQSPPQREGFVYSFAPSERSWGKDPQLWRVVEYEPGRYAYEGGDSDGYIASDPPEKMEMLAWQNYSVEMSLRILQPGVVGDNFFDGWVSIRHDPAAEDNCTVTNLFFDVADQLLILAVSGGDDVLSEFCAAAHSRW